MNGRGSRALRDRPGSKRSRSADARAISVLAMSSSLVLTAATIGPARRRRKRSYPQTKKRPMTGRFQGSFQRDRAVGTDGADVGERHLLDERGAERRDEGRELHRLAAHERGDEIGVLRRARLVI